MIQVESYAGDRATRTVIAGQVLGVAAVTLLCRYAAFHGALPLLNLGYYSLSSQDGPISHLATRAGTDVCGLSP